MPKIVTDATITSTPRFRSSSTRMLKPLVREIWASYRFFGCMLAKWFQQTDMYSDAHKLKRTTLRWGFALAVAVSLVPMEAQATTFILGPDPVRNYTYGSTTVPAAPYAGQLVGTGVS